jgi:hypothetical protein
MRDTVVRKECKNPKSKVHGCCCGFGQKETVQLQADPSATCKTSKQKTTFATYIAQRPTSIIMPLLTRKGNASTHPGQIINDSGVRRPSAVVQAEKAAKAEAKAKKAAAKAAGLKKVAKLENKARKRVKDTDQQANDPPEQVILPAKTQSTKEAPVALDGIILSV